jgi:aminopeptidase N
LTLFHVCRQYKSADQNDLWRGLANGVLPGMLPDGVELKTIMDSWALQAGVPVVTVTRNYDTNKATVTQVQYTI